MRGLFRVVCLTLAVAPVTAGVRADEATLRADPGFRLLELGGRKIRWAVPENGLPTTIRYAFLTEPTQFSGARNCDAMLPPDAALGPSGISLSDFRHEVRAAFSAWEKAANIVFVETESIADAGILIGADAKARGRAFTNVAPREETAGAAPGMGAIRQSLICLNPLRSWKIGFDGNLDVYDLRFTMTHEIGHAIGLDHPGAAGQLMGFRYVETTRGLQGGDIAGAVALYGRPGGSPAPAQTTTAATSSDPGTKRPPEGPAFGLGEPAKPRTSR